MYSTEVATAAALFSTFFVKPLVNRVKRRMDIRIGDRVDTPATGAVPRLVA